MFCFVGTIFTDLQFFWAVLPISKVVSIESLLILLVLDKGLPEISKQIKNLIVLRTKFLLSSTQFIFSTTLLSMYVCTFTQFQQFMKSTNLAAQKAALLYNYSECPKTDLPKSELCQYPNKKYSHFQTFLSIQNRNILVRSVCNIQ